MPALPAEIWLLIIRCYDIPDGLFVLPAQHEVTKVLLSLCRTSKQLRAFAQPQLFRHCVHIDHAWRLTKLLDALDALHHAPVEIDKLYLAPFFEDDEVNNRAIAASAADLLTRVKHSLKRLVLDAVSDPTGPFYDKDDIARHVLLPPLRDLENIEEFICISVFLFWTRPQIMHEKLAMWSNWKKLRRFALCCASIEHPSDVDAILRLQSLEQLTLVRCAVMFPERFLEGAPDLTIHIVDIRPPFMTDASRAAFASASAGNCPRIGFTDITAPQKRRRHEVTLWLRSRAMEDSLWRCEMTGYLT